MSNDINDAERRPYTAMDARPPSNLPMGRRFNADEKSPVKPIRKSGWRGMTWVGGKSISLGAIKEVTVPNTTLDLRSVQGTTG
mmetsp:Transcript_24727/g.28479  ORF Transcript_24727/g.28479 Transcript_24727/m.28479 type:complete len:83 (-) Transcript_24727:696-944(-)